MRKKSRTEITFETDRVFVIRQHPRSIRAWCDYCSEQTRMLTPDEATRVAGLSLRAIYRLVESGKIHFTEPTEGPMLVCVNSLSLINADGTSVEVRKRLSLVKIRSGAGQILGDLANAGTEQLAHTIVAANTAVSVPKRLTPGGKGWILTKEAFDKLLERLDGDRERAAQKYENIRRKLITYFECRGCLSPEDRVDETMNRVARRISEGAQIWTTDPASYFNGVARYVLKEYWGGPDREYSSLDCLTAGAHPCQQPAAADAEAEWTVERALEALEHCMRELTTESRELILDYYRGEKGEKVRNRQDIAKRLGIPLNALRIRVHRIRESLERDVNDYLQRRH